MADALPLYPKTNQNRPPASQAHMERDPVAALVGVIDIQGTEGGGVPDRLLEDDFDDEGTGVGSSRLRSTNVQGSTDDQFLVTRCIQHP